MDRSVSDLIGSWKLTSCEARSEEGDVEMVYGPKPFGRLVYSADGSVTVIISGPEPRAGTALVCETPDTFSGVLAYCGSYRLGPEPGKITHSVEWSSILSWNGSEQVRFFERSGELLTIATAPYERNGKRWVSTLVWRR